MPIVLHSVYFQQLRTADQLIADSREQATHLIASAEAQADNVKRRYRRGLQMAEEAQFNSKRHIWS